jgi:hydrogenase maturation protease
VTPDNTEAKPGFASTLFIAYGNADRQDDGVGWAVLSRLAGRLNLPFPAEPEDELPAPDPRLGLLYTLQLTPELAEVLTAYDRVMFIDAHAGALPDDLSWQELSPVYQRSPLTHHMTAESLLSITHSLYGAAPRSILVSVRGQSFGFERGLTPFTDALVDQAVEKILAWLQIG